MKQKSPFKLQDDAWDRFRMASPKWERTDRDLFYQAWAAGFAAGMRRVRRRSVNVGERR